MLNGVLSGIQGCLKAVQWVFKGRLKGVSRGLQVYLDEVQRVFQGTFNVVSKTFYESLKGV